MSIGTIDRTVVLSGGGGRLAPLLDQGRQAIGHYCHAIAVKTSCRRKLCARSIVVSKLLLAQVERRDDCRLDCRICLLIVTRGGTRID